MKTKFTQLKSILAGALILLSASGAMAQWSNVSPAGYSNVDFFDVKFFDDNNGIAVGRDQTTKVGYILKTTNGGTSWTSFSTTLTFFRAAGYSTANNASAVGYDDPSASAINIIYNTVNAGTTWTLNGSSITHQGMEHAQFVNPNVGYATGYAQFGLSSGVIKTTNGGSTWTTGGVINTSGHGGMYFTDVNTGYAACYVSSTNGLIRKTTDGGTSWNTVFTGNWTKDVCFVNLNNGFALEGLTTTSLITTSNAGSTWSNVGVIGNNVSAFIMLNATTGVAVGGASTIRGTTNGGGTWNVQTVPNATTTVREISASPAFLWVCGNGGNVWKSPNPAVSAAVAAFVLPTACVNSANQLTNNSTGSPTPTYTWSATGGAIFLPNANATAPTINFPTPGVYTITLAANNGTLSTVSNTVTASPLPTISVIIPSQTVCALSAVTFSATGGTTYSWSAGGGGISFATYYPAGPAIYTVTGTSAAGCSSSAMASVSTLTIPPVNVSASQTLVCTGQSTTLTATGANTYTWMPGSSNGTTTVYTPTTTSVYSVQGTGPNGCSTTKTISITYSTCAGINEATDTKVFSVYPNPSTGIFNVTANNATLKNAKIVVRNIIGQEIMNQNVQAPLNNVSIDLSQQNSGLYIIDITSGIYHQTIKVIKN